MIFGIVNDELDILCFSIFGPIFQKLTLAGKGAPAGRGGGDNELEKEDGDVENPKVFVATSSSISTRPTGKRS